MERVRGYDHDNHDPKVFKSSEVHRYKTSTGSLDVFSSHLIGKSLTITLINGRIESGILTQFGQYDIELKTPQGRMLIIIKSGILTVVVI
jgi:sRNA-binding regulator protein Hfq